MYVAVRNSSNLPAAVMEVLNKEMSAIYADHTPEELNSEYIEKNKSSLPHRLAGIVSHFFSFLYTQCFILLSMLGSKICHNSHQKF